MAAETNPGGPGPEGATVVGGRADRGRAPRSPAATGGSGAPSRRQWHGTAGGTGPWSETRPGGAA
eukprot:scaffold21967_cov114-Isochrysis_galbana.AAC.6